MNSYDEILYPSLCYSFTHPDRLEAIARLLGLKPTPSTSARILELGCSSGGNLLPMAETLPDSSFVGIELSKRQVALGRQLQAAAGLTNVTLLEQDILAIGSDLGKFDYIIAHGVYSWTPPVVRNRLLIICRQLLAANGVAYVSYNALPGWKMHGFVREMLLSQTRLARNSQERVVQARGFLRDLHAALEKSQAAYSHLLLEHVNQIGQMADGFLAHDHLEVDNQPVYFQEFVAAAEAAELQFVSEANPADSDLSRLSEQARGFVLAGAKSIVDVEQKLDFLCNRSLRRTLLAHRGQTVDRHIDHERARGLYFAADIQVDGDLGSQGARAPLSMQVRGGRQFSIGDPIAKCGFIALAREWPKSIRFEELGPIVAESLAKLGWLAHYGENETKVLAESLIQGVISGVCEIRSHWPRFVTEVSQSPRLSPLSLAQLRERIPIANRRHEPTSLDESAAALLKRADGTRLLAELESLSSAIPGLLRSATQNALLVS